MYKIQPHTRYDTPLDLPACMYIIKPVYQAVHFDHDSVSSFSNPSLPASSENINEAAKLQEKIISKLSAAHDALSSVDASAGSLPFYPRMSISAHPANPPYATLALIALLECQGSGAHFSCHVHSSVPAGKKTPLQPITALQQGSRESSARKFTFAWSESGTGHARLVVRPRDAAAILGDVNIARYLARAYLPIVYPEMQNPVLAAQIDELLSYASVISTVSSKDAEKSFKKLDIQLSNKSGLLFGQAVTLADIALAGAIRAHDKAAVSKFANVSKWYHSIIVRPEFAVLTL